MNAPKNEWVLCHSKSFPGKLYYFNVANGETVWSLNSNEKNSLQKGNTPNIKKPSPRTQGYLEPTTPPDQSEAHQTAPSNNCPSTSNQWPEYKRPPFQNNRFTQQLLTYNPWPEYNPFQNGSFPQQIPAFGQPAQFVPSLGPFMPGMPNMGMPNFIWTPVALPTPGWPQLTSDEKLPQAFPIERDLFVHSSGGPLSQKFVNYEKPTLYFNKEKKIFYILKRHKNFESSIPIKHSNSNVNLVENQASTSQCMPEQNILNTESNIEMNNVTGKSTLDTSDTVEIPDYYSEPEYHYNENDNSTFSDCNKVQCPISQSDTEESSKKDTSHLHKHDLRFVLIAKKRKLAKMKKTETEKNNSSVETKKVKFEECKTPLKKRVTFDLNNHHDTSILADDENEDDYQLNTPKSKIKKSYKIPMSPTQTTLNYNRMLEKNNLKNDIIGNSNNKPTHDIQAQNISTQNEKSQNMPTQNMSRKKLLISIPKHFLTQKQYTVNNATTNTESTIAKTSCTENKRLVKTHSNKKVQTMENEQDHPTTITTNMPKSMPLQNNMPIKNQVSKNKNVTPEYENISTTSLEASNSVTLKESADELLMGKEDRIRKPWYLVVDMVVLLDDLEMVDGLLKSDDKCRLLIPHCMRTELDALCIGDCRGQKRVLVARQLSRRMTTSQEQCIMEPPTEEETNNSITTHHAILNSCIRVMDNQQFVVLITNDTHLKATASANNIRCFSTEEIQNGAIVLPKLFSELKKIRVIVDNNKIEKNNIVVENQTTGNPVPENNIPVDTYKRELFADSKNTDRNDLLIDITKPKNPRKIIGNDSNVTSLNINNLQLLNSKDTPINRDKNSHSPNETDLKENHVENVSNVCNLSNKQTANKIGLKIRLCRSKLTKHVLKLDNKAPVYVENDNQLGETDESFKENQIKNVSNICNLGKKQNSKKIGLSNKISKENSKTYKNIVEFTSKHHTTHDTVLNSDNFNTSERDHEVKVATTVGKQRIEKIMSSLNTKSPKTNEKYSNQHSWQTFKIPRLSSKKGTTSAQNESPPATDEIRSNFKIAEQWLEEHLKKYNIKSAMIHDKLTTRMEEWTCTFTQIMENVLDDVLQINAKYVNQVMVSDRILHEMLTCIKMLYDDAKLRDIVELLVEFLNNYTCSKGKFKLDTPPQDFMKILGCGVVLVQVLQTIVPNFEGLSYYESLLDTLVSEIGSKTIYLDPELLRPTAVCRSEIDDTNKEARQYFSKNPSMIIEYLKKHYKEWSAYDERQGGEASVSEISPYGDTKVVRIFGKNINMLKIDNKKSFSYDKTAKDNNSMSKTDAETKLVRLLGIDNPNSRLMPSKSARTLLARLPLKQQNIVSKENQSKINKSDIDNDKNPKETKADELAKSTEPKIISLIENINLSNENIDEEYGHTFATLNDKTTGPKVIRNFKIIDEHEKKIKNKEPLDLDMLDYSEIYDNSNEAVSEKNYENDKYNVVSSDKSNKALEHSEKCDNANNDNSSNVNDKNKTDPKNNVFYYQTRSKSKGLLKQEIDVATNIINNENDTMIKNNDDSAIINDINTMHNSKDDFIIDFTNENDCVKKECNETNEEINNENDTMNTSRDDSTNDSGFENESSQAYSLVQIFLMELGSTLKEIYRFIYDFVKEIREEALCEERKNHLYLKSNKCLQDIRDLIQQLKSIIERESYEDTAFKTIIFRSSVQATKDPKMTRYRQIIKKCLMQAEILQKALEVIVCITMGDLDGISDNVESVNSSFKYFII